MTDLPELQLGAAEEAEFNERLAESHARLAGEPIAERFVEGKRVVWVAQPGSQEDFLSCPIFAALYHGTRGPGKTDALLMAFAQHVGKWGSSWRGIIFRETYPQLADVVAKSERWFRQMFPEARFNRAKMAWEFETGEVLLFRHMRKPEDYYNYHGHEYPFIGWEELTNWADDRCYKSMFSCCRSSDPRVPRMIRATTNPYGVGHDWIKRRFKLDGKWWETIIQMDPVDEDGVPQPPRVAIHGHIDENKILLAADPHYKQTIAASAQNQAMADAWLNGSWSLIAGGMFSDVWSFAYNAVGRFDVPHTWRIDRAFDWGSSKPFSVGWYAVSDGTDLRMRDGTVRGTVRGDVFRVREWYGCTSRPNEGLRIQATDIAEGIVERELIWGWRSEGSCRVLPGVADSSIFTVENGHCIATDFKRPVRIGDKVYKGVRWKKADKSPGSRKNGWELVRKMLKDGHQEPGQIRERPGFFVVADECPEFLRTMLSLPRDEKDLDDVNTDAEDHIADEVRYRLRAQGRRAVSGTSTGLY